MSAAAGPPSRSDFLRAGNDRIAEAAARERFDETTPIPLLCECGDPDCHDFIRIGLGEYRERRNDAGYILTAGHTRSEQP